MTRGGASRTFLTTSTLEPLCGRAWPTVPLWTTSEWTGSDRRDVSLAQRRGRLARAHHLVGLHRVPGPKGLPIVKSVRVLASGIRLAPDRLTYPRLADSS